MPYNSNNYLPTAKLIYQAERQSFYSCQHLIQEIKTKHHLHLQEGYFPQLVSWKWDLFFLRSVHSIRLSSQLTSICLHTLIAGAYGELISLLCCPVRLWGLLLLTVLVDADGWERGAWWLSPRISVWAVQLITPNTPNRRGCAQMV